MKERLTGAVILVALMVLLVPELLTGPIPVNSSPAASATVASSTTVSAHAAGTAAQPVQGAPPLRTYTLTLGTAAPAGSVPPAAAAAQAQPPSSQLSASAAQPTEASAPGNPAAAAAQAPMHGGALSHTGALKLTPSTTSAAKPASLPAPHPSQARQSTAARPALQVAKPSAHRAVREARSPASSRGWVVQLGVFADHRNAVRLAGRLQHRGFRIAVSPLRVRSRSLWRVSTAPPQSRAAALHTAARLRAAGHRGDVLPAR